MVTTSLGTRGNILAIRSTSSHWPISLQPCQCSSPTLHIRKVTALAGPAHGKWDGWFIPNRIKPHLCRAPTSQWRPLRPAIHKIFLTLRLVTGREACWYLPHMTHQRWDGGRDEGRGAGCGEGAARGTRLLHLTLDDSHERPSFPVPMTSVRTALDWLSIYTLQQSTAHPSRCLGRSSTSLQCFRPRCRPVVLAGAREGGARQGALGRA